MFVNVLGSTAGSGRDKNTGRRVDVPVNMQYKFQQSSFMNPVVLQVINRMVDKQLLADPGTQSAHCAADRGPSQVQFWGWLSTCLLLCNDRCPVGSRSKLWSLRSCSVFGRCPVPGQSCCARRCNDCGSRNAWFDYGYMFCIIQGGFWKNLYDFLHEGVDSVPEVDSPSWSARRRHWQWR